MKKKLVILVTLIALALSAAVYAYDVGYCLKCRCHQYQGGSSWNDHCTNCGHDRAEHI